MNLGSTLRLFVGTHKPLTGEAQNGDAAPAVTVYRNGILHAPAVVPVVANPLVGTYSIVYGLTAANGHAMFDWVTIMFAVTIDSIPVNVPVWEGCLASDAVDVVVLLGQTIYPCFTTHQPSTGANQAPDLGAAPTVTVYRDLALTALAPVLINPATGVYFVTMPMTAANGWAAGNSLQIYGTATVDGIVGPDWCFESDMVVAGVGGGGASHVEILGNPLRHTG